MRKHFDYFIQVLRHKWFVFIECCKLGIPWLGVIHDLSKFRPSEWGPYVLSFYGGWEYDERPGWLVNAFDVAWLHHQKRNKHHWKYWILIQDEGEDKVLPMPDKYRREMLADLRGMEHTPMAVSAYRYYIQCGDKMQLHPDTRVWIEEQLGCLPMEELDA